MFDFGIYIVGNSIICLFVLGMTIISYKSTFNKEKSRPFERGFDPSGSSRLRFCMKFFLVGVIFLIFDVEVSLIMPLPYSRTFVLLFLFLLVIGLVYE